MCFPPLLITDFVVNASAYGMKLPKSLPSPNPDPHLSPPTISLSQGTAFDAHRKLTTIWKGIESIWGRFRPLHSSALDQLADRKAWRCIFANGSSLAPHNTDQGLLKPLDVLIIVLALFSRASRRFSSSAPTGES